MTSFAILLKKISKLVARRKWLPILVNMMTSMFKSVLEISENDGLRKGQLILLKEGKNVERERKENCARANERLIKLEKLFDISPSTNGIKSRVMKLKVYFESKV